MPIDPRIALGYQAPQIESPLNAYAKFAQIQGMQQEQQMNALRLAAAQREEEQRNTLNQLYQQSVSGTGELDKAAFLSGLAQRNLGSLIPGLQKQFLESEEKQAALKKTQLETQGAEDKQAYERLTHGIQSVGAAKSGADVIAALDEGIKRKYFTQEQADAMKSEVAALQTMPEFQKWQSSKLQQLVSAKDQLDSSRPKPQQVTLADGSVQLVDMNPNSPTYSQTVRSFATGMRPGEKARLEFEKEKFSLAREKVKEVGKGLTDEERSAISAGIAEGRVSPDKVNGRNAKVIATTLLENPGINMLELGIGAASAAQAGKSLAVQSAKMLTAANEASSMTDIVRNLSAKLDRTQYPNINAITNAVSKGTGGTEVVQLNAAINALVNAYARAISPTGQPTVSDKNHAREVINSSYSSGQIGAILDVMKQEMDAAQTAATGATTHLREAREKQFGRGPAAEKPSGAKPSLDEIFGR